ncbi:MAG: DUF1732 domain-containing protein, partial [Thermoguttaceae bacterium]|nr:DUF1732 domain-containing protein [Thermoguttaceae bacterium]
INEEKQRLTNHLKYFRETLAEPAGQGKKLGFIAQEMGRSGSVNACRAPEKYSSSSAFVRVRSSVSAGSSWKSALASASCSARFGTDRGSD